MPDLLITIGAILLLIFGAAYPLIAIYGLVSRMNRKDAPPPAPLSIMLRFFLIATVPIAGILGGFAGLVPAVWASLVLRILILAMAAASLAGFVILAVIARMERNKPSPPGAGDLSA